MSMSIADRIKMMQNQSAEAPKPETVKAAPKPLAISTMSIPLGGLASPRAGSFPMGGFSRPSSTASTPMSSG